MRLSLIILFAVVCLTAGPAFSRQGGKNLFKIDFDPAEGKGWRFVDKDDDGKSGLVLEVNFRLQRLDEAAAAGRKFKIVIEEDGKRAKEKPLALLAPDKLTAVLAVDISNSMELVDDEKKLIGKEKRPERRIDAAKRAAKVFFRSLAKTVDCGLILFDDKIQTDEPPCGETDLIEGHREKLIRLVDAAEPRGGTAYIDAIDRALDRLEKVKEGRKAVVLVTDGVDLHSKKKMKDVVARARKANIPIWTIGIGEAGKSLRLSTVLALDKSGSMKEPADNKDAKPKIEALKGAAASFIDSLHPMAEISLLPFSTEVGTPGRFLKLKDDEGKQALKDQVNKLRPDGETAFLSAAYAAIGTLEAYNPPGMRLVVVLTDGIDNSSRHRMEDVIARAKEGRVRLYMLGFGREQEIDRATMKGLADATNGVYLHARNEQELIDTFKKLSIDLDDKGIDEKALRYISGETKGKYQHVKKLQNLTGIFEQLAREVQSNYVIRFQSLRQIADGTSREISIRLVEEVVVTRVDESGKVVPMTRVDEKGNVVPVTREVDASEAQKTKTIVSGVVVPQMHSMIYLGFLAGLGLLIALPGVLRKLRRPTGEV